MKYLFMMSVRQQLAIKNRTVQNFQATMMLVTVMQRSFLMLLLMWLFLMAVKLPNMTRERMLMMVMPRKLMTSLLLPTNLML